MAGACCRSDFAAYKRQRHRWAYGGVQLIKKHWRAFIPGRSHITTQQRTEFLFGWLTWLGAESLGVVIAVLNLIWMPLVVFLGIAVPQAVLTIPVLAAFTVMLLHFMVLYRTRVQSPMFASLGAAFSAMALQLTVARAVADGAFKDGVPFFRTAKGSSECASQRFPAFWEAVLGTLLLIGSLGLYLTNEQQVTEIYIFSAVMLVQSLPFIAAVVVTLFERSALNDFATWRGWQPLLLPTARGCRAAPSPPRDPRRTGMSASCPRHYRHVLACVGVFPLVLFPAAWLWHSACRRITGRAQVRGIGGRHT